MSRAPVGAPYREGRIRRVTPLLLSAGLTVLLAAPGAQAATEVPSLAGRVDDTARMTPPSVRERLEIQLWALEERMGAQVAVLTVNTLGQDSIEEYAVRVFETWKLGRRGVNDGGLFVVARWDHQMRIEVGYGLEARLTDARSRQILDDLVRPHFRPFMSRSHFSSSSSRSWCSPCLTLPPAG